MYSKSKGMQYGEYTLTPPPGYDGSRFRRRSDGRDDAFPFYGEPKRRERPPKREAPPPLLPAEEECEPQKYEEEDCCPCECADDKKDEGSGLLSFIQGLPGEEILLIALIILLAGSEDRAGLDTVLILALLLCL